MPPKGKKQNAHDKRHENGLAPPGKRIQKPKSDGNTNGELANGRRKFHPPPSFPSLLDDENPYMTLASASEQTTNGTTADAKMADSPAQSLLRRRTDSDTSLDRPDTYHMGNGSPNNVSPSSPTRTNANTNGVNMASAYSNNALTIAKTILAVCPLRDAIAILILLLQLPPTVLTIVHFLFASSLYAPSSMGTSFYAFPSLNDIFQGSGGTPSLPTIIIADIFVLFCWLTLWPPAQAFFLDIAHIVIAISLAGTAAGRNGMTRSIAVCLMIVLASHILRLRPVQAYGLQLMSAALIKGGFKFHTDSSPATTPSQHPLTGVTWVRALLDVHIVTQGVVRVIRRSLSRLASSSGTSSKKNDPEANVASGTPRNILTTNDPNADAGSNSSTDGRPPGPSPAAKDNKDRVSSSRRKKKQAMLVRGQQPFWASVAELIVGTCHGVEKTQASADALEGSAKDINHIGNANFITKGDRVWISEIGTTSIHFGVSLSREEIGRGQDSEEHGSSVVPGIDKSKPFYVRVNATAWGSTRIHEVAAGGALGDGDFDIFTGEIFGLTGLSNYQCEFVRVCNDEVIYSASLITQPAPCAEQAAIASPSHTALRPSSPTTTLKTSIAATDQKLADLRNRLKRTRKEHKSSTSSLKKEVDTHQNRLSSTGGQDERTRQRMLQLQQAVRQAEESATEIAAQIADLGDVPEADMDEYSAKKQKWQEALDRQSAARAQLEASKAEADRELSQAQAELASVLKQRERLQARLAKLNEQHERLVSANASDQDAKARRLQERAALHTRRVIQERSQLALIAQTERQAQELEVRIGHLAQQRQQLEAYLTAPPLPPQQQHLAQQHSAPTTPEGVLPSAAARAAPFSSFTSPGFGPLAENATAVHHHHHRSNPASLYREGRGRSSSMLSGVSGLTDDLDLPAVPVAAQLEGFESGRKGSGGTSSGSGSGGGSQRDPMSPPPKVLSPVGAMGRSPPGLGGGGR